VLAKVKTLAGAPLIELREKLFDQFYRKRLKLSKEEYFSGNYNAVNRQNGSN